MCYRINANEQMGGIKTKSTGSFAFSFHPGHARFTSLADILFHPAPLESLFADQARDGINLCV